MLDVPGFASHISLTHMESARTIQQSINNNNVALHDIQYSQLTRSHMPCIVFDA